jgi:SAM-dependent methyltransferase
MDSIRTGIELLQPEPEDWVLDIGFGGGYSLLVLAEKIPRGHVVGVELSRDMVDAATRFIRARRLGRRVRVGWGDVADLPFAACTFNRAFTMNTIYYWPDLRAGLREIARVLEPGGRLAVGFHSPGSLRLVTIAWDKFRRYSPEEVAGAMRKTGFRVVKTNRQLFWGIADEFVLIGERR